jgi:hypothetical protein
MPKVSRDSAPQRQDAGPVVDLRDELDGYTVSFTSLLEDIDATPLMKGLPDNRCQCPHWGYLIKGKMTARYADHDEVFEAGDAFYTPPGHVPVNNEPGTEILWFSPKCRAAHGRGGHDEEHAGDAGRPNASVVIINLAPTGPLVDAPADKPALVSNRPAMTAV